MSRSLISFESKQKRILILQSLLESLKTHYPKAIFDKSKEGRYRLLIPYTTKDQFIVDFSFEVPDGIRMGFVLDIDQPEPRDGGRRKEFQKIIAPYLPQLAKVLDAVVIKKQKNESIIKDGRFSWIKNSAHRRMGLHQYRRFSNINFENDSVDDITIVILPVIERFIKSVSELLAKIKLPN
ncbi:hypothetical protein [Geobacillus vulcani]|uniref:hypothetical protein n=1 Tax=Geobacillus vulcani TaxID=135517 RepID=UPI0004DF1F1E|nr:hypothetical protein [Geobacillus vulcani]